MPIVFWSIFGGGFGLLIIFLHFGICLSATSLLYLRLQWGQNTYSSVIAEGITGTLRKSPPSSWILFYNIRKKKYLLNLFGSSYHCLKFCMLTSPFCSWRFALGLFKCLLRNKWFINTKISTTSWQGVYITNLNYFNINELYLLLFAF